MALISQPPNTSVDQSTAADLNINQSWGAFFSQVFVVLVALTQSGTTAQRPVKLLFVGRTYFDTTLNRPIWYTGTNWIRADGVVV